MLPETEFKRLYAICINGLNNIDLLTDFDFRFLKDNKDKFEQYRRHTYVSDAQDTQFDRIEQYLQEELGNDYIVVRDMP